MPRSYPFIHAIRNASVLAGGLILAAPPRAHAQLELDDTGKWTQHKVWSGTAVHMALLPGYGSSYDAKVLWWFGLGHHQQTFLGLWGWKAGEYDCSSYPESSLDSLAIPYPDTPNDQIFCSGMSRLGTGELFLPGGTQSGTENGTRFSHLYHPVTNSWSERDSMADFRWYPNSVSLSDGLRTLVTSGSRYVSKLHFFGGRIDDAANPSFNGIVRYGLWGNGVDADTVRPSGQQPDARTGHSAGFSFSRVYAVEMFGGKRANGDALNDAWLLRVSSNNDGGNDVTYHWQRLAPAAPNGSPSVRYGHGAVVVDTTTEVQEPDTLRYSTGMYVVGGTHKSPTGVESVLSDVWRLGYYNPRPNQEYWTWNAFNVLTTSQMPGPRTGHSLIFDHDSRLLLLFGGRNTVTGEPVDNDVWAFHLPETGNSGWWEKLDVTGERPESRYDHACGYDFDRKRDRFFIFGGELGGGTKANDFWEFNISTLTWTQHPAAPLTTAPSPRSGASLIVQGSYERAFVFGGTDANGSEDDVVYTMTFGHWADHLHGWTAGEPMGFSLNKHKGWMGIFTPINRVPEIFEKKSDPANSYDWEPYPLAPRWQDLYPQGFVKPDGDVFYSGPGQTPLVFRLATHDWQVLSSATTPGWYGGSAVMYREGKVMKCGTRDSEGSSGPAVGTTKWIDVTQSSPTWNASANGMKPRVNHNLVLLPNGQVFVTGGTSFLGNASASGPVHRPEIWDPEWPVGEGHWYGGDTLAADPVIRDYHSTAILLPDARILGAGGNVGDQAKGNVYCPPYLFSGNSLATRPVITSAPERIQYGTNFIISMPSGTNGVKPCLIRAASVTHGFDQDQRYVPLTVVDSYNYGGTRLLVQAPANGNLAPPGDYLLFILNAAGVPAVAKWVRVGPFWDMGDVTAPGTPTTFSAEAASPTTISLSFTAPGDNGQYGHAVEYELRYSHDPLNQSNAGSATRLTDPWLVPAVAGTVQSFTFGGFSSCYSYYFALRTKDESNNWASSWSIIGPIYTTGCTGGGCGTCEAHAINTAGRQEAGASSVGSTGGRVDGTGAHPATPEDLVLVADYATEGARINWTVSYRTRGSISGLDDGQTTGAVFQSLAENTWVTRLWIPDASGGIGLRKLIHPGRVVLLESGSIGDLAVAPPGFDLSTAVSSRTGTIAFSASDTSLVPELGEGDTLSFSYVSSTDTDKPGGDYFLLVRSGARTEAAHAKVAPASPLTFALHQNRPNPFATQTSLSFTLPEAASVRLDVFDMQGRRVRTLANQWFEAGDHEVSWDRKLETGALVRPGVYFYRIEAAGYRAERRLIVLP